MYRKEIIHDEATDTYAMYLDGDLIDFAPTFDEAKRTLDQLVFELMSALYIREG